MCHIGKTKNVVCEKGVSETEDLNGRGNPLGRWKDMVEEYMCQRGTGRGGGLKQAKKECLDREVEAFSFVATPIRGAPGGSKVSETIGTQRNRGKTNSSRPVGPHGAVCGSYTIS